jgi:hypothetical protein
MLFIGDTLYIGGQFDRIGGQPRTGLAALDLTGAPTSWAPALGLDVPSTPYVGALATDGSSLYVGGSFGRIDGHDRTSLAAFDSTGALASWAPSVLAPESSPSVPGINGLAMRGSTVYVLGNFTTAGGMPRSQLAAFDAAGQLAAWDPDVEIAFDAFDFPHTISSGTEGVYVGGSFKWLGKESRRAGLAAILPDGRVTDWNPGVPDGVVRALAVSGGTVYVGGEFATLGGQPRANLAAIDASGAVLPWNPGADGPVYALAAGNGAVYAGGRFFNAGGQQRMNLAAFDASGRATAWVPQANALVTSLAVDGSTIYAGGYFTGVTGRGRMNLAAIDATGRLLPWNPPTPGNAFGYAGPLGAGLPTLPTSWNPNASP